MEPAFMSGPTLSKNQSHGDFLKPVAVVAWYPARPGIFSVYARSLIATACGECDLRRFRSSAGYAWRQRFARNPFIHAGSREPCRS